MTETNYLIEASITKIDNGYLVCIIEKLEVAAEEGDVKDNTFYFREKPEAIAFLIHELNEL